MGYEECEAVKRKSLLVLLTLTAVAVSAVTGRYLYAAKRQYILNRQLIAALVNCDSRQARTLVDEGANPNTRLNPLPNPTLLSVINHLLHHDPAPDHTARRRS